MSIKSLFNNKSKSIESANSGSVEVESKDYILERIKRDETFLPYMDFSSASNFAKFGSAEEYYKNSIERIHGDYPYDGSQKEKLQFELSSSYLDKYIFDQRYPKTNGYINFSYGGWGSLNGSIVDGFGLPTSSEYIYLRGGIHVATGMDTEDLRVNFDKSIKYNSEKDRITSLLIDPVEGFTVEFWLKKNAFDLTKTNKEVVLDLWNSEISSSAKYGRFTLALSGTTSGEDTFVVTLQSGSSGFYEQSIGTATVTTSSLSSWHHYAFSFVSASNAITSRLYIDGNLNESKSLGSAGLNKIGGRVNGYIGALQTNPSGSSAAAFSGKLSASLDDFRYWKTRRTSKQIHKNWYRHVGGGTNTDDANTKLGVYYKFNEGIVGTSATDSIVLDYSGRLVNGSWTGYTSGARSTNSAFVESGLVTSEEKDPIIYATHADVSSLKTELMAAGKVHDDTNTSLLYNRIPKWIRDADPDNDNATKYLIQIMASYFDTLHAQITALPSLKNKVYPSSSYKPLPFAKNLLEEKGLITPNLFTDSSVLEMFEDRDVNQLKFEEKITDIKNQIYTNIYNNLEDIYKHKGTEGSIRNMLRCFGLDDEIVKLNIYTDHGTQYFTDSFKHTSVNKNFINFNKEAHNSATIFNQTSSINSNSYISGSGAEKLEQFNALSAEISIVVPKKLGVFSPGFYRTDFLSSSVFGMHEAIDASALTWASPDLANFQVYLVREEIGSSNAKFVLKDYGGNINLESDVFKQVYSNEHWNLAVRIKPEDYPIAGNVVTSSNRNYTLEFYGVTHAFDTLKEEFSLSTTLNYTTGSAYLSNRKRFYVGAHRTNFTGAVLQKSDIKVGRFNSWLDYIDNSTIKLHNKDITSKGIYRTHRASTIFGQNLTQYEIPSYELGILDWDFETVKTSDGGGNFIVTDTTSGSTDSRYGWIDDLTRRLHNGAGFSFPASSTNVVSSEIIHSSKKELPEISYSSDGVRINGELEEYFIEDEDVSDNFYALEKSMNQVVSEEMMKTLSTAQEMSNLIGEAVERYRLEYKKLNNVRRMFFEDVEENPDFDRFTEYFKFIDSAMSYMVSQMFPISVRFSKGISDVVESHLFERNKYQNKFPLITTHTATEASAQGVGLSKYRWEFGHAPIEGGDNNNCLWQKSRAERSDISQRETIKDIINNRSNQSASILAKSDRTTYTKSTYGIRNFSKPVDMKAVVSQTFHPGINYSLQKDRDYIWNATNRHSELASTGVPKNVLIVGAGEGQGVELPKVCNDVEAPNQKKKFNVTMFSGKFSDAGTGGSFSPINDSASYNFSIRGKNKLPFNIFSGSVSTGYNSTVVNGYKTDAVITNIHSDTTDLSNDLPLQGPFSRTWVGGHQSRHVDVNRHNTSLRDDDSGAAPPNNLHNLYTRPEAWRLIIVEYSGPGSDGSFGLTDPQYGVTKATGKYPDIAKKSATLYRDGRAKRPFNISNIQTTTSSVNHGNYSKTYDIISMGCGTHENNFYLRDNPEQSNYLPQVIIDTLPETTHPMTLISQDPYGSSNSLGIYSNNPQPDGEAIVTASAGTVADGRFTITGSTVDGAVAQGSFRVSSSNFVTNADNIRISRTGTGETDRFYINSGASAGGEHNVSTGASTTAFYTNLRTSIRSNSSYDNTSFVATDPTFGVGVWNNDTRSDTFLSGTFSAAHWGSPAVGAWSCAFWIYVSSSNSTEGNVFSEIASSGPSRVRRIYVKSNNELVYEKYYTTGNPAVFVTASWSGSLTADDLDKWTHVVIAQEPHAGSGATAIPAGVKFSINTGTPTTKVAGVTGNSSDITGTPNASNNFFFFSDTSDKALLSGLDEFGLWNVDLGSSNANFANLYNGGLYAARTVVSSSNLKAWWRFGDDGFIAAGNGSYDLDGSRTLTNNDLLYEQQNNQHVTASENGTELYLIEPSIFETTGFATFTVKSNNTGSSYNGIIAETNESFSNTSNITGGTDETGASDGDTIVIDNGSGTAITFELDNNSSVTSTSTLRGIDCSDSVSNSDFWNALSQSIKDYTVYDTITITAGSGTALFELTSSTTGSALNVTMTETGDSFTSLVGIQNGTDPTLATFRRDIVIPRITSSATDAIIGCRFAAPGGIEIESYGYLDAYAHEYSVYNSLNYRNLTVRGKFVRVSSSADGSSFYNFGGSGEANTIRVNNDLNQRDGHKALLSRHCGKYGVDTRNTSYSTITSPSLTESQFQTAVGKPSFHKQQRNENRRPSDSSTIASPVFVTRHDNMYINSPIPRSDFQYKWVTSSIGSNYSITSGKQRMYGYAHPTGILSSSVVIDGDSGFVPAITFPTASEIFGV